MKMTTLLQRFTLAAILAVTTVLAQTPYDEGQKALREQRWMDAADQFEQAIEADQDQADSAMYWRAHALYKAGRRNEARREVRRLERTFPDSRWVKEAQVLQIENPDFVDSMVEKAADPSGLDDELRMFALSQLMDRNPQRALPLVLDAVRNSNSQSLRESALFILGMSEQPAAQQAIAEIARDGGDPELQVDAIHLLGAASTETSIALLADFYTEAADPSVKEAVIHAYSVSDEYKPLVDILQSEENPELQQEIIYALGVMEATEELGRLYSSMTDRESRIAVLESMSIADDTDGLFKVLQEEEDPELRTAAIESLAISGGKEAADYLVRLYPNGSQREKAAVIESMMIMDAAEGLIGLLKQENDPELKREILQVLSVMDSEESDNYLFELLENEG